MQTNMFEFMYDTYQIKNKIKLIEFFAGYGSQNLALKCLGANYEHHRICEWATKSIQAYNDIHIQDYTDYSQCCTFDEIVNYLFKKGISMNYNEPMTFEQIKRKGEKWCRNVYNNIIATKNLVNIQQVKAKDLDISDKENYTYLLTYSFPCQDISGAGLGKGFAKGSGTRSGMLWEVERILNECYELNCLPQCLVMENVPLIHNKENYPHLLEWIKALEKLGYQSYWQDLNAVDYGVPQNRNRTFMVSILGNYNYTFPKKFGLELRLKDLLEETVDEKYYLSQQMIEGMMKTNFESYKLENKLLDTNGIANCIIARFEGTPQCVKEEPKIKILGKYIKGGFSAGQVVDKNGIAPTFMEHHGHIMAIVEENFVQKKYQTFIEKNGYIPKMFNPYNNVEIKDIAPTQTTQCGSFSSSATVLIKDTPRLIGGLGEKKSNGGKQYYQQDRVYDGNGIAMCRCANIPNGSYMYEIERLSIRKLTPKECLKLMGLKNEDIVNISKNQSDSSLYHLAGDSIVTTCLMAIFGELLGIDWQSKISEVINDLCYTNIN